MSVKNMKITHKFSSFLGGQREKTVGFHLPSFPPSPPKKRAKIPPQRKIDIFFLIFSPIF